MRTVKIAISLPDETFSRVSQRAVALGMGLSEFFARAAQHYLDELDAESLTSQIDRALDVLGAPDDTQQAAVEVGRRVLTGAEDDW